MLDFPEVRLWRIILFLGAGIDGPSTTYEGTSSQGEVNGTVNPSPSTPQPPVYIRLSIDLTEAFR